MKTDSKMKNLVIIIVLFLATSLKTEDIHIKNLIVPLNPKVGPRAHKTNALI